MVFRICVSLLVPLLALPAAAASAFFPGEVLVGGRPAYSIEGGLAYIKAYSASGIYQCDAAQLSGGHPRDALMLGEDVLFSDAAGLVRLHPDGSLSLFAALNYYEAGLAIDGRGNVLVGSLGGTAEAGGLVPIVKLSPAGQQVDSYWVASDDRPLIGVSRMDLAADQCTLYYATSGRHVKRFDVCQNHALPDLVDFGSGVFVNGIRVLPDGSVLAATTIGIVRVSSSGTQLRVYGKGADLWTSLSVDGAGTSFWAGSAGFLGSRIEKFDLNSGAVLAGPVPTVLPSPPFPPNFALPPEFVLVVGERRAAQADPAQVPALSLPLALALILLLAIVALLRLR